MKSTMDRVPAWLALMTVAILTFTFTACSDDEDIENEVTYTYVFTEISASHPDFLEEKGKIENAFKSALGATGSNFTKRGTVEECDKQVYAACEKACNSLKGEVWQGDYLLEVTNTLTEEVVWLYSMPTTKTSSVVPRRLRKRIQQRTLPILSRRYTPTSPLYNPGG